MTNNEFYPLGAVVFFVENKEGVYDKIGRTSVMLYRDALDTYANTPNPASQLVGGYTPKEVEKKMDDIIKMMKCRKYVEEYVNPFI